MTRQEIEERLEKVEKILFYIDMIDRWTWQDREDYHTYSKEKRELKEMLKKG